MATLTSSSTRLPTGNEPEIESISIFDKSMTVTFLQPPPSLNASVLIRTTYHSSHALIQRGKKHPQNPPYHLHFSQSKSLIVLQGRVGATTGYDVKDTVWTRANTVDAGKVVQIPRLVPHTFWPVPRNYQEQPAPGEKEEGIELEEQTKDEDAVVLLWAHPHIRAGIGEGGTSNVDEYGGGDMDYVFFRNLFLLGADISESKAKERAGLTYLGTIGAMSALNSASDTALVVAPTCEWLGPLRWYLPLVVQKFAALVWTRSGQRPDGLVEAYVPRAYWERLEQKKDR